MLTLQAGNVTYNSTTGNTVNSDYATQTKLISAVANSITGTASIQLN
ncbi:hypothetical protein SBF1_6460004 [Candidatus Desulfosporosinus infrequens]|uniref:Uncharacterized protein n=1 Tax=Candidatus Desulfosporosinus infrequens TaxID=2043169 RepID=A0A2U3LN16_9FIRM|nr:hypothetical protein SBF1_6460004 [Candidatus Desulfosporosinus infrequens]